MLATLADVETALGGPVDQAKTGRVEQLLRIASDAVLSATGGFQFEPGTYTSCRKVHCGRVRIPARVESVSAVSSVDPNTGSATPITGWTLRGNTLYGIKACTVDVTYTVAEVVPQTIADLVSGVVAATMSGPPVGASSMDAGIYRVSFVDSSNRVWFSKSDKAILARYRGPKRSIELI